MELFKLIDLAYDRLNSSQLTIFFYLIKHSDENGQVRFSIDEIIKNRKTSKAQAIKALKELAYCKMITQCEKLEDKEVYAINPPELWQMPSGRGFLESKYY